MRLGQLSRKLDIKPTEIREFIRNEFNTEIDLDLNTRIEDQHAEAVTKKFEPKSEPVLQTSQTAEFKQQPLIESFSKIEQTNTEPLTNIKEEIEEFPVLTETRTQPDFTASITESVSNTSHDVFTPLPVDPEAELIKAPKIKLEGLKVVGKIELPSKKEKEVAADTETSDTASAALPDHTNSNEKGGITAKRDRKPKQVATQNNDDEEYSIFKDKKGIYHFSQTQRENRKNSIERIKREKLEEARKLKKAKHYQQFVDAEKKVESPKVKAKKQAQRETKKQPEKPVRKGVWGRFLNWLNG